MGCPMCGLCVLNSQQLPIGFITDVYKFIYLFANQTKKDNSDNYKNAEYQSQ